jgi:hypothetical protein
VIHRRIVLAFIHRDDSLHRLSMYWFRLSNSLVNESFQLAGDQQERIALLCN